MRVFRVTVRGRFHQLSDDARRYLTSAAPEHDILLARYTEEGTFSYDDRVQFFTLRYEVRAGDGDSADDAATQATAEAELFLHTMRIGFAGLRAHVMDMTAMVERSRTDGPT
jgi:hypothetical protein